MKAHIVTVSITSGVQRGRNLKNGITFVALGRLSRAVLKVLLQIGGIELNPGPNTAETRTMDFKDADFNVIDEIQKKHVGKDKWRSTAEELFGVTFRPICTFIKALHEMVRKKSREKYNNISVNEMIIHLVPLSTDVLGIGNVVLKNSVWGSLSESMFHSNNKEDRAFLHSLWELANQVEDLGEISDSQNLASKLNLERRRKSYKQDYFAEEDRQPNPSSYNGNRQDNSNHANSSTGDESENIIAALRQKFEKMTHTYFTAVCDVCLKTMVDNHIFRKKRPVTDELIATLRSAKADYITMKKEFILCHRCDTHLSKGKVPSKALVNKMLLLPVPYELNLTLAEKRLITQVKAYMKVYVLQNGRGQKACKGMTIHFPTEVSAVIKQLPLTSADSDFIIVKEKNGDYDTTNLICPRRVMRALKWLKSNNPLYKDVTLNESKNLNVQSIEIDSTPSSQRVVYEYNQGIMAYNDIGNGASILRASFSQNNPLFGVNAGSQCTPMSGSFLAHCYLQSPLTWTRQDLDGVLLTGNEFYAKRQRELVPGNTWLAAEQVQGNITVFGGVEVNLAVNNSGSVLQFEGFANRSIFFPKLDSSLKEFIDQGNQFGILTMGGFSMGIFVDDEHVYYFDSHNRGEKGFAARTDNGKGCVIKIPKESAPTRISSLANRNCIKPSADKRKKEGLQFTLLIFIVSGNEENPSMNPRASPLNSPRRKNPRNDDANYDSDSELDDTIEGILRQEGNENPIIPPVFGSVSEGDSVVEIQDPVAPHLNEAIANFELERPRHPPIPSQHEDSLDLLAFPHLFPHGENGVHANRVVPISPLDYYQQRLMSADPRFAGESEFLFYALNHCDKHRIKEKIAVCGQQKRQGELGDLRNAINEMSQEDLALAFHDPHVYMGAIRGSSSYWRNYTGDLLAMVKTLGTPTFFFTFSYDDLNSVDSINALYRAKHGADTPIINPLDLTLEERKDLLNDHPITAARQFSKRLSAVLSLFKSDGKAIFGREVLDYSVRVEFQARGSPHAHMLLWLKDVPNYSTQEGIDFIERNISSSLGGSNKDLVERYQKHRHTKCCFKNGHSTCRFGFAKPESETTRILCDDEIVRNKGRFFEIKRTKEESMIGYYHPLLLSVLRCNMDIQIVTSAVGVCYYIAKYMGKCEPAEVREQTQKAIQTIQNSSLPAHQKMFKIALFLLSRREVSAQEAAFRLMHLYLRKSSRATVFIPSFRKEKRIRMIRKETLAQGEIEFCPNIIERYEGRPASFEHMCLLEFASNYELVPRAKYDNNVETDADLEEFPFEPDNNESANRPWFRCKDKNGREIGRIRKRTKAAVIKHPNFHPISDPDAYYYSLLLLYLPFREETFCDDGSSPVHVFERRNTEFRTNADDPCLRRELAQEIDRALILIADFNEEENEAVGIENQFHQEFEEEDGNPVVLPSCDEIFGPRPSPQESTNVLNQLKHLVAKLNPEQRKIFDTFHKMLRVQAPPIRQLLLAPGGTGKSHLCAVLSMLIKGALGNDSLLLGAPTGKAAFAIKGLTLHKLFSLPVQKAGAFIQGYQKLNDKRLSEFRQKYRNLKFIFLDEVSMISYQTLRMIHLRLCEIFANEELFGGISVLLLGDLLQLAPVNATPIFKKPKCFLAEVDLWRQFQFSELTINMRQCNDPLGNICSELREGNLSTESFRILQSRLLSNLGESAILWDNAPHIFPEKAEVAQHNDSKIKELRLQTNVLLFKITAQDTYADGPKQGRKVEQKLIPTREESTGGIPTTLQLAVGAQVMLRANIDCEIGLCNGSTGLITRIEWPINPNAPIGEKQIPSRVWIKFDHDGLERAIAPITRDFFGKYNKRICRRMIPIILCFACTVHKFQGATLDRAVVDLGRKCKRKGQAYVALSRVKTLEGLALCDLEISKIMGTNPVDLDALTEIERLRATVSNRAQESDMEISQSSDDSSDEEEIENEGNEANVVREKNCMIV